MTLKLLDSESGLVYKGPVKRVKFKVKDGIVVIGANYCRVIEKVESGSFEVSTNNEVVAYESEGGWLTVKSNLIEAYLSAVKSKDEAKNPS